VPVVTKSYVWVKKHGRTKKGITRSVTAHRRKKRKLGKKIRYKKVGSFFVAFDDQGNFRGSKIKKIKTKKVIKKAKKKKVKRRKIAIYGKTRDLDTDYYLGRISHDQWIKGRKTISHFK